MPTRQQLQDWDRNDALASFRSQFGFGTEPDLVYCKGNSLGRMPLVSKEAVQTELARWEERVVRGWNEGWYTLPQQIGKQLEPILGAKTGEVIGCDSTSVNLYKTAFAALESAVAKDPNRVNIVSDAHNFPSDLYVLAEVARQFGGTLTIVQESTPQTIAAEDLLAATNENTGLISYSHVSYRSGQIHDSQAIVAEAHKKGARVLLDLSHAAGSVELSLHEWEVDYAIGCGYKYLNGGPGAPAFLFVHTGLQSESRIAIPGWFGHAQPFQFEEFYEPAEGIERFLAGTPPILSMAALNSALQIVNTAGIKAIAAKGRALTSAFIELLEPLIELGRIELLRPPKAENRGAHVAVLCPNAYQVAQALIDGHGVVVDFRRPDALRFGFSPLYTRFEDVYLAAEALAQVLQTNEWERFGQEMKPVT